MVDKDKLKEIEKLSPKDRIQRLKELEEADKKEIEKAQQLIKDSEQELKIEERVERVKPPERIEVNVKNLFKPEQEELEETVRKEAPRISEEESRQQQQYMRGLQTQQIEQKAEYIQQKAAETGYVSNEQRQELSTMYQELKQREDSLKQGTYKSAASNIEETLSVAKKIIGDLYKR